MDIVFACSKDDKEFGEAIYKNFADADELKNFSFSGMEEMILFIVPIAALTIQVIDFVWTHMKDESKDRFVIINGRKKYFKNYTKDEIVEILKVLENE